MSRQNPKCPKCDSGNAAPIVYGCPSDELFESADRGEAALGGCCFTPHDTEWRCKDCEYQW